MFLKFYFIFIEDNGIKRNYKLHEKKDPLVKTWKFCKEQKDPLIDTQKKSIK